MTRLNGFKIGICRFVDGPMQTECLIWNHNAHGALLEFQASESPGAEFHLLCSELGIDATCRVVWRDWGVAYTARCA